MAVTEESTDIAKPCDGVEERFQVASFLTVRDGLVVELVEVWTDIGQTAPEGTRERQ